ncbi:MAG: ABC transporter substrate-binding protein [Alkalilacustris sp.]
MSRRILATALLAGLASPAAAQQVTLDVLYCNPSFSRFYDPIAEAFMERHPDIAIAYRAPCANYDEGHQTVLRSAVTGQLPHLFFSGFHLLEELARTLDARGDIVDLAPLLQAEGAEVAAANFDPAILDLGRVDGTLFGLAFNASTPIVYVNRDLVARAGGDPDAMPDTWDDMIALAAAIDALGEEIEGISYDVHAWPDSWAFQAMIFQQGGALLDDAGEVAFDNEIGLRTMEIFRRFVTEGGMEVIDRDQAIQQFAAGRIGLTVQTPARVASITDMVGDAFELGTSPFPIDDKDAGGIPTGGNAAVILTHDPALRDATWDFVRFMTGPEAQAIVVQRAGYLPVNLRTLDEGLLDDFYTANPNFRTVADQMDRARPWQGYPGGESVRIWRAQRDIIGEVMRGTLSPEDGLAEIVSATRRMMN